MRRAKKDVISVLKINVWDGYKSPKGRRWMDDRWSGWSSRLEAYWRITTNGSGPWKYGYDETAQEEQIGEKITLEKYLHL